MRFEHFGLTKMMVVLAPFALALSFVGCSGESSTAADGNSDDQENSATNDSSSGKDSSSSSSSSSKKGGSSGKDGSSSSSKKDGSSNKDRFANVDMPDVEIGKCDFKKDDEVWAYAYTETEGDDVYEAFVFTVYDGESIKDSIYFVFSGSGVTQECKQIEGKQKVEDELYGTQITSTRWCEDGFMYVDEVMVSGGMNGMSRKSLFEMTMDECTLHNGVSANSSSSSAGRSSSSSKNKSSSSNGGKSSSSGKDGGSSAGTYNGMTAGCNFKKGDKVWMFYLKDNTAGVEYKSYYYEYKEGGSIDSTHTVSEGSLAKQLCSLTGPEDDTYTSDGQTYHEKYWCTDKGSEEFKTIKGVDPDCDRDEAFSEFMRKCRMYNGLPAEDDDEEEDSSSSSEKGSSSSAGDSASGSTCDFEKDDDVWVMDIVGVGLTTLTWSGDSYTAVTEISMKLADEAICEASVENADPEDHAYCEGSVYKSRAERVVEDADRDETYENAMAMCAL